MRIIADRLKAYTTVAPAHIRVAASPARPATMPHRRYWQIIVGGLSSNKSRDESRRRSWIMLWLPHCRRDRKEKSEYQDRPGRRNAQDHGEIICQRLNRLVAMVDPNPCRFKK